MVKNITMIYKIKMVKLNRGKLNGLIKKNTIYSETCEIEYLNGYKNGKGKISYENGKYLFEGEYAQDMKIKGK